MSDFEDDDDAFDDLFNYDIDNINTTFDTNIDAEKAKNTAQDLGAGTGSVKGKKRDDEDLGVDGEVKIRKRKPIVKLDEERLLGPNGIPYLQENAAKKIKFKGKGHELSDIGRLLKFYQIWADNLYPKAQFGDVIEIVEKLGNSRGMQRRREEWIEGFKMKERGEDERLIGKAKDTLEKDNEVLGQNGNVEDEPPETLYAKTGAGIGPNKSATAQQAKGGGGGSLFFQDDDDGSDMDELDALMREVEQTGKTNAQQPTNHDRLDDEMDELDAIMREMEEGPNDKGKTPTSSRGAKPSRIAPESDDEFEDAMVAMREAEKH